MMKMISRIFLTASSVFVLAACNQELWHTDGGGALTLDIRMGEAATRAAMSQDELLSTAKVSIYKGDFSGKVREYVYSRIPQTIYLPADDYRVDVVAGEQAKADPAVASWDQMSYKGSSEVKVTSGTTSGVTVTAKVCNIISNITFDDSVADTFTEGSYSCTVSLDADDASQGLTYTASEKGKDGFFISSGFEPSLYWKFTGTLKKDGSTFTKSGEISSVEAGKRYKMSFKYTEKDGLLGFDLLVDDSTNDIYDNIIFEATSTGVASSTRYEVWAAHFTAHADVDEAQYDKDNVYFEVRQQGTDTWTKVTATRDSEGSFSAVVSGLNPSTVYEYRLVVKSLESGEEERLDAPSTVTTEAAPALPNGSFETTSNDESDKYLSFYDPSSSDASLQTAWWGNGNYGSTLVGSSAVVCYPDTGDKKDGNQSVCLQSRWVVIKFAAGNLFSGHFGDLIGTNGGTVFFGRPFTGRPTALRFWMKYSGGVINREASSDGLPEAAKKGNPDKASIRVAIGTWNRKTYGGDNDSPIKVDTTDPSTFVDFTTDPSTIAYGEKYVPYNETGADTWQHVTLPLTYNSTTSYPTHIVVSFAASMYGDYFCGYDESKLWLDAVELIYE